MPSYAAFLGHQPHISLAELAAAVPRFSLQRVVAKQVAIFESSEELEPQALTWMGGIFSIAKSTQEGTVALEDVPNILEKEVASVRGKVTFGLRTVNIPPRNVHMLYRNGKERMKRSGRACRYVGTDTKAAPAVLLHDEGLITGKHGCEITVIAEEGKPLWIGRTIAAQDVDAYTKRDMEKPVRDTRVGLLPPKLAQSMLNFGLWLLKETKPELFPAPDAKGKKAKQPMLRVLDPFCGTGVVAMEALLRHWEVFASDASLKAVNGCEKNMDWLRKEEEIFKKDVPATIWKQDARKAFALKETPHMIVSETTLGTPLTKRPTLKDAQKHRTENDALQIEFLENMASSFPGTPIACMWPVWYASTDAITLQKVWKKLEDLGYKAVLPPGITPLDSERPTLLYHRPGQFVGREIVMLKPI